MNAKKLHEVEILSGVISRVFAEAHATHVVDVGAGQGYLAQVLAFEYGLPVVALDASSHHADVTSRRSARIEKHYAACSRKANSSLNTKDHLTRKGPQTATFCVMSGCSGKELQHFLSTLATEESSDLGNNATDRKDDNNAFSLAKGSDIIKPNESSGVVKQAQHSYILAGLHACGDLSAAVLKTYTMCEEVKAVVIVGCCYNLLTERLEKDHSPSSCFYGFPLSRGVRSIGLRLGRRACDLACQSAERWKDVGVDSALYNFEQHALRAGFQLVLHRYYPELAKSNPTIGRLGKARRRKQVKRHMLMNTLKPPLNGASEHELGSAASDAQQKRTLDRLQGDSKKTAFIEFCSAAVQRLGLKSIGEGNLVATWAEIESKTALVGAYWSLRAVLGPVLETFILLDRLLYLQEEVQCAAEDKGLSNKPLHEPKLIAVFDPSLSPRNMAIMAIKS